MSRSRRWTEVVVFCAYVVLSVLQTWPLALYWRTHVLGGSRMLYDDVGLNVWNMWWARWAIEHGLNPFWTPLLYAPEGSQMVVQTLNLMSSLLTLPVNLLAGPIAAYNAALLLAFVLTGYGGYLLVRAFVSSRAISFLCGALLAFAPYMTLRFDNGHLNLISIQWLPLYFLALTYLDRRGSWWAAAGATAAFVCATLTDWHWALFGGVATAVWVTARLALGPNRLRYVRAYGRLGVLLLVSMLPLVLATLRIAGDLPARSEQMTQIWEVYNQGYASDALGLLFPAINQPWWGDRAADLVGRTKPGFGPNGWYIAAGQVLAVCAALGIAACWRRERHLLVVMLVLWLLSLGPSLYVLGFATGVPLPYALLENVPVVSLGRRPSHFAVIPLVLATVVAGIGVSGITRRRTPLQRRWIYAALGALAAIELAHPAWQVVAFEQPAIVQQLRTRPGTVADLPYEQQQAGGRSLRNQLVHEQPILGGFVSRRPAYPTLDSPLIWPLVRLEPPPSRDVVARDRAALMAMQCFYRIRHVLLRTDLVTPQQRRNLENFLQTLNGAPLIPADDGAQQLWYELPLSDEPCRPFVYPGQGWYAPESDDAAVWRWSTADSRIVVVNPFDRPIQVLLSLSGSSPLGPRWVALVGEQGRIAEWSLSGPERSYLATTVIPPGTHVLSLLTTTALEPGSSRELGVSVSRLELAAWSELRR